MPTIDVETSIAQFLELGRRLEVTQPLTGQQVLAEMTTWYQDIRIKGAAIDADMLLLQWGATRPLLVDEPTDLRNLGDDDLTFSDHEVQYLDFTRQVHANGEDQDADFDASAVQMSITLGFARARGDEPASNHWISNPADIDVGRKVFVGTPFVQSLLLVPAKSVAITIGLCG